jgi:hypothetical protein
VTAAGLIVAGAAAAFTGYLLGWALHRVERLTPHINPPRVRTFDEHWETNRIILLCDSELAFDPVKEAERLTREAAQ